MLVVAVFFTPATASPTITPVAELFIVRLVAVMFELPVGVVSGVVVGSAPMTAAVVRWMLFTSTVTPMPVVPPEPLTSEPATPTLVPPVVAVMVTGPPVMVAPPVSSEAILATVVLRWR